MTQLFRKRRGRKITLAFSRLQEMLENNKNIRHFPGFKYNNQKPFIGKCLHSIPPSDSDSDSHSERWKVKNHVLNAKWRIIILTVGKNGRKIIESNFSFLFLVPPTTPTHTPLNGNTGKLRVRCRRIPSAIQSWCELKLNEKRNEDEFQSVAFHFFLLTLQLLQSKILLDDNWCSARCASSLQLTILWWDECSK